MIGVISNRGSGHNAEQFEVHAKSLEACAGLQHVITKSPAEIAPTLRELAEASCEHLVINGGDGTVAAVLGIALEEKIFRNFPKVIILPSGTANMTAGDVGISGNLSKAVDKFCQWTRSLEGGEPCERVMLRLEIDSDLHSDFENNLESKSTAHYGMFMGAGAIIQGTEYAHEEIHSRGLRDDFSVGLGALRTAWGIAKRDPRFARPLDLSLTIAEHSITRNHQAMLFAISSLDRLFLGMNPFWGSESGGLKFTLIEAESTRFLRTFQSILRGKPNSYATAEHGYFSHNANQIQLQMDGKLNLDGEILTTPAGGGTVKISATQPITFLKL